MGPPKMTSSKRWRPTAEQVMILKGLFKAGVTTPSAQQIQRITTQLKEYGKVETKNVFYWFQNHKARDKQKKLTHKLHHHNNNVNNNHLLYCFYLPTAQQPSGIFPIFPAQATSDVQWRMLEKPEMTTRYYNSGKEEATRDGCSSMDVTLLTTDSECSHQQRHQERLKTLQLFPTSSSS